MPSISWTAQAGLALFVGACLCGAGCANVASPSGGPEDRSLPKVAAMHPDSGTVGAHPDTISILFTKKMERSSVRDWLFVTPPLDVAQKIWKGNRYDLVLGEAPDSDQTYTILLGSEVVDRRNNALGPWAASFSTGATLDDGAVEGKIRSGQLKAAGSYLYAWSWSDSLDPAGRELPPPVGMGQSLKDGGFRLCCLPRNTPLRVCALYDAGRDRSFDPEGDLLACYEQPITLGDTTGVRRDLEIYLVLPDEPGTLQGSAVDSSCILGGVRALRALDREADSLAVLLGITAPGDSLAPDTLLGFVGGARREVDSTAVRLRLAEIDSLRPFAQADSARCAAPVIVRLFEQGTTLLDESQGGGAFEFRDVSPGNYRIRAFRDEDGNGEPGPAEAGGEYPIPIELAPGRTIGELRFPLGRAH